MQEEGPVSQSLRPNIRVNNDDDFTLGDDIGKFVGDASFSDVTSDDSSGWMHKIDVTNFQRLTSTSSSGTANLQELASARALFIEDAESIESDAKPDIRALDDERRQHCDFQQFSMVPSTGTMSSSDLPPLYSSHPPYTNRYKTADAKVSPPRKKSRQLDSSSKRVYDGNPESVESLDQQPQISVVSSTSDASRHVPHRQYPKPVYSYSCMIALALKNSQTGRLQVAEIYCFMCENYPYFRTAPAGWKNSVRHNLSLNKCFEKIEVEAPGGHGRKCCLWTLNPQKAAKMDQEIRKYREKDPVGVRDAYARPDDMELVELGLKGMPTKLNSYHPPALGRALLPDVVQPVVCDSQRQLELQVSTFGPLDRTSSTPDDAVVIVGQRSYPTAGRSDLARRLLEQAASYRQHQWSHDVSSAQQASTAATSIASWLPPQLENNQSRLISSHGDHCPLELSPVHQYDGRSILSPSAYSTPLRRSSLASVCSPFARSQPADPHQRPSSLQQLQRHDFAPSSFQRQPSSPLYRDVCPLPVFSSNHGTPERPASCGYFGMIGGNNSLLVTPTSEGQQQGRSGFGMSLETAFCAASSHNNSLIMQSMQQFMGLEEHPGAQQQGAYPLPVQPVSSSPLDGSLHLTSL